LSLSDLLNLFDGLIRPQNIICVFSTNHPENIDPAFVRDGRMDLTIELKKASIKSIAEFLTKKYSNEPLIAVDAKYDRQVTMATIENVQKRSKTLLDFFVNLDAKIAYTDILSVNDTIVDELFV